MCRGLCWPEAKLCIPPPPPPFFPGDLTGPEPTLPPEAVWPTLGFPLHRMSRWNLFYLCPAFCRRRNQGHGCPWVPCWVRFLFLRGSQSSLVGGAWEQALSVTSQALKGKWGRSECALGSPGHGEQFSLEEHSAQSGTQFSRREQMHRGFWSLDQCLFPQGERK